jgi:hypothetical protein
MLITSPEFTSNLTGKTYYTKSFEPLNRTVCMMVNLLDDSNFHRQTAVMTRLIEMIIQNPVIYVKKLIIMLIQFKFGHFLA